MKFLCSFSSCLYNLLGDKFSLISPDEKKSMDSSGYDPLPNNNFINDRYL